MILPIAFFVKYCGGRTVPVIVSRGTVARMRVQMRDQSITSWINSFMRGGIAS